MAVEIKMPQLSQTTDEVRLINWLVHEGDTVQKGDPLCEVETDKVTMAVESFESGTVLKLIAEPDTVIDAGTVIAVLGERGEQVPEVSPQYAEMVSQDEVWAGVSGDQPSEPPSSPVAPSAGPTGDEVHATRLVRNIAQKQHIDLNRIRGTGPRGIITKRDLELYIASRDAEAAGKAAQAETGGPAMAAPQGDVAELTPHQRAVAHSLTRSSMEAPHFYLKTDLICDRIVAWREEHRKPDGKRAAVDSFFIYAVSRALQEMPRLNGFYKKDSIVLHSSVDINVAITAGDELYAPLLCDVHRKSIEEIDTQLRNLARKTRENRLEREDMRPGSFTVTNLGMFPVDEFGAIINPPQSGILSIGRMRRALVVGPDDAMVILTLCTMTGSFDHRIVNGAQGAAFMRRIQEILEGVDIHETQ
jgi:pyruvate dehydrogenase E2 component (dihydrolipoamide acetyltransferase)